MEDWHMISSNLHRFTEKLPIRLINKWCGCFKKKRKKERCDHQEWALVHCWFISALTPLSITSVQFSCSVTRVFSNTTVQSINSSAFTSITSRQYGLCPAPSWAWERQAPGCAKEEFPISDGHLSSLLPHTWCYSAWSNRAWVSRGAPSFSFPHRPSPVNNSDLTTCPGPHSRLPCQWSGY